MTTVYRPVVLENDGVFGRLPAGAIINIGGVQNSSGTFTINGQGVLLDDGSSSSGSSSFLTLQTIYDRSSPASIVLSPGKDLTIYDDNNSSLFFRIDSETGKVTITGDLEVLGSSTVINTVVQDSDHWVISPQSGSTIALKIEPDAGVIPIVDIVSIRRVNGENPVFRIDKDGNIIATGLFNGIDISQLYSDLSSHIAFSSSPKHTASEISVSGPFTNIGSPTNVQQALITIDSLLGNTGGPTVNNTAGLFFIDATATSSGIVGDKQYVPNTVPTNKVIQQATTDTDDVTVQLFVEPDATFYSPTVTITTVPPQTGGPITATLTEDPQDKRAFIGTAQLTGIVANTVVNAVSSTGATASMIIIRGATGPAFASLTIGPYPGTQTAVKAGDTLTVTGSIDNSATYAELLPGGANSALVVLVLGSNNSAGPGLKTVSGSFTVSNLTGEHAVTARGRNSFGTYGLTITSSNTRTLDQTYPTIGPRTITYPPGQSGIKGSESATVSAVISNFDTVLYTAVNMTVSSPTVYGTKTVTRTAGSYLFGVNNFTITATRTSNGAVSTASAAVTIANVAPTATINIVGNPARLASSPTGNDYTVVVTADQNLLTAPSLSASSGTWQGAWTGSGAVWSRVLRITDADPKGNQLFSGLQVTGLAGLVGNTITAGANYVVGGFSTRTITFPPFARWAPIGTSVSDFSKVTASYTGSSVLTRYPDTNNHFQGFTIVNSAGVFDPNGSYLFISDAAFAGANTTGTLQLDITEAVSNVSL